MKRGRAGRNRKKPKEQKVNEHSFPWLPYLTPLFSTHTSSYSVPFVLSVRSSSRPEQEGALPRHVLAVTHRSRASVLRVDAARELTSTGGQGTRTCLCSSGRPSTARQKCEHMPVLRHFPDSLFSIDNQRQKWQEWEKVAELILLHRTAALCPDWERRLFSLCNYLLFITLAFGCFTG